MLSTNYYQTERSVHFSSPNIDWSALNIHKCNIDTTCYNAFRKIFMPMQKCFMGNIPHCYSILLAQSAEKTMLDKQMISEKDE